MKTIICPNYLKNDYINLLLEDNSFLTDVKILPLNAFYPTNIISNENLALLASKKLNEIKDELSVYKNMIQYPSFINEVLLFVKDAILYDLDINKLKINTAQQKELKKIISTLVSLQFPEHILKNLEIKNDNFEILDFFTNNFFEYKLKQNLINSGAKLIKINEFQNPDKKLKFALNKREEIEAVAQEICIKQNAFNSAIICCDLKNQLPIIKQVFSRYNIPIKNLNYSNKSIDIDRFLTLLNFSLKKDFNSFIDFISLYKLQNQTITINFFKRYITNIYNIDLNDTMYQNIENIEKISEDYKIFEQDYLKLINTDFKDLLKNCFEILTTSFEIEEKKCVLNLRNVIEDTYPNISTLDDLNIIIHYIKNIENSTKDSLENGVTITSINKPIFNLDYAYVIGCTSKLYPGFSSLSGVFDENYIEDSNYPKLSTRHSIYFKQLEWIKDVANKEITYSYFISDLSGKTIEAAFEIENMGIKKEKWNLLSINTNKNNTHFIPKELADKIFKKDGKIYGSISSFENYYNCPYKYFIASGLKIREQKPDIIGADTIGNIIHSIMQQAINKYGKKYFENSFDEFIAKQKDSLLLKFPKEKDFIDLLFNKIKHNIEINMIYFKEMEIDTSFNPEMTEYRFNDFELIDNKIVLNGIVDRIDFAYDLLRVIDYKTGSTDLSLKYIEKGLSLQLITYLIICETLFNKKPLAGLYYNFPNKILDKSDISEKQSLLENFINNKRLNGIIFTEDFTSLTSKDKINYFYKTLRTKIEYDQLKLIINEIFNNLYEKLSEGDIDTRPSNDTKPCVYCPYISICRHNGTYFENEVLYSLEKSNKNEME